MSQFHENWCGKCGKAGDFAGGLCEYCTNKRTLLKEKELVSVCGYCKSVVMPDILASGKLCDLCKETFGHEHVSEL